MLRDLYQGFIYFALVYHEPVLIRHNVEQGLGTHCIMKNCKIELWRELELSVCCKTKIKLFKLIGGQ